MKRPYSSLHDWMERTGTPQVTLGKLAGIKPPHLSRILRRSRRCSLDHALKLSDVTGVPVENLLTWGKAVPTQQVKRAFKRGARKCA